MAEFKVVINDIKTGKSYQKISQDDHLLGKKIKDKIDGKVLGLNDYELEVTGGTDNAGFPMRNDVDGISRRKVLIEKGIGLRTRIKGTRFKKSVVGNTISSRTAQINLKIIKHGSKNIEELLGIKKEEVSEKAE